MRVGWFMVALMACTPETGLRGKQSVGAQAFPEMSVSPTLLDFGALSLGGYASDSFTVSNTGEDVLEIDVLEIVGEVSFLFIEPPILPFTLDVDQERSFDIMYTANGVNESATVEIIGSDPVQPTATVDLVGTWAQPALCIDPDPVSFADIPPMCSEMTTVVLESCGTGPLTIDTIGLQSKDGSFTIEGALPSLPEVLDPGDRIALDLSFAPEAEGVFESVLIIESDDPGGRSDVSVLGNASEGLLCDGLGVHDVAFDVEYKIADVAFLLDLGKWHTAIAPALAADLAEIAADVRSQIPDVTFGVASYRDYAQYGASMYPYKLEQQQTDDVSLVIAELATFDYNGWSGGYATGFEALYQAASGAGYDEDCDVSFDSSRDTRPFRASPLDAFHGVVAGTEDPVTPGTGREGGMGFREKVLPIIVLVTHSKLRDPDKHPAPGGCSQDATLYDAYEAFAEISAKFVGVWGDAGMTFLETRGQLEAFAISTGSYFDIDGDYIEEPAVVDWDGSDAEFRRVLAGGIKALASNARFDKVELEVFDPAGVVVDWTPDQYSPVSAGTQVAFTLTLAGEVVASPTAESVEVLLELMGDDTIALGRRTLYVEPE